MDYLENPSECTGGKDLTAYFCPVIDPLNEYQATYRYAASGTVIAIAILSVFSAIYPINGVQSAPPMIAITRTDPPILVFSPRSFILIANIVGYIRDIKKLVRKIAHIPIHPGIKMLNPTRIILMLLYNPISLLGCM